MATETKRPRPKRERIVLPFERRRNFDIAEWAYDHRAGLMMTVIAYLLLAIAFVSSKIVISDRTPATTIYIDMQDIPEPRQELTPEERRMMEAALADVRNVASNESARDDSDPERGRQGLPAEVSNSMNEMNDRLRANSEAYRQGLQSVEDMRNSRNGAESSASGANDTGDSDTRQDLKQVGNVTVSYDLGGRQASNLPVPAYRCEGEGQVVVAISVNRNGDVTGASVQSLTASDPCLRERALEFAKMSRFAVDPSVPASQKGTITYLFIRQ